MDRIRLVAQGTIELELGRVRKTGTIQQSESGVLRNADTVDRWYQKSFATSNL